MSSPPKVLAICGSINHDSVNGKLITAIQSLAKNHFEIELYDSLSVLPYFNASETDDPLQSVIDFRNRIEAANAVLICTPEYIFSLPGILKNAIEWTVSTMIFADKPAALITASSSGKMAHESLLFVMKTLGVKTTKDTELLIQSIKSKMTKEGVITDEDTLERVKQLVL